MLAQGSEVAFISNSYGDTVSVIDVASLEVVHTIAVDHGEVHAVPKWPEGEVQLANTPMNPTFTPDGREVWLPNPEGYNLDVIDPASTEIVRTIDLVLKPNDIEFTPDGERAVVTLLGHATGKQGAVTVLDVTSGKAAEPLMVGTQPEELVLMPDGKRAYVVSKSLWVIDVDALEVDKEVHLPNWCYDAVLAPDAATLYLTATFDADKVVTLDTATNTVTGAIEVLQPACMAFSHDGGTLFVSNVYNNSLQKVDLATGEVSDPSPCGELPSFIALTAAGDRAFVCHPAGEVVTVVDTDSLEVVTTIPTGVGPCAVAIGTVP